MQCPQCHANNREGRRFCGDCGAHLLQVCPACRFSNEPEEKFCGGCGQVLLVTEPTVQGPFALPQDYTPKYLADKILTSRSALEGERKQVTVVFCDLANSTGLAEKLGPDRMHAVLNKFFEVAIAEVHRYEGTINQFLGDGFMALFGAPLAYEDHARRAVMAAMGIQQQLGARQDGLLEGVQLRVRIGLNTGLVVVGKIGDNLRMDYTAIGDTTNLAARLQALAEPGAVYISEQAYRLVTRYFVCEYMGRRTVKGKALPVAVYKVLTLRASTQSDREAADRRLTAPLVGRTKECHEFLQTIDRLLSGRGGIVSVVGEAGVGKSRFMAELRERVEGKSLLWLEGRAPSYGRSISYLPFREIIRAYAGITDEDDQSSGWGKLERSVRELFPTEAAEILPYVATLLGLEVKGEYEKRVKYLGDQGGKALVGQILLSSRRLFERMAQAQPVVLIFEDAHWYDQSSAELLEHLSPLVHTVPLLICTVSRADPQMYDARLRETAAQKHAGRYTEISLGPLSQEESTDLLSHLLKADVVSPHLRDQILAKAEGNPFFMEEVIRSLVDMKALVRDAKARCWQATAQAEQAQIPDSLQAVIIARVDRLEDRLKEVLKLASVIGRRFLYSVLQSVAGGVQDLDRHLEELQELQFIREKSRTYFFKHALVQEATYESILVDRRREIHRRVAESIETLFANEVEEYYGIIAYHYARSEEWEKAQEYLFKAGDQAGKIAADAEALFHYEQAVSAYGRAFGDQWDPIQRAVLERKIGEALFRQGDHEKASEYFQRALTRLGNPYPVSRLGIRTSIARQLVRQLGHRLLPGLLLRDTGRAGNPLPVEEQSRIFKVMTWIDYFVNQERMFLDGLQQLNVSERNRFLKGLAWGSTDVAMVFDLIPILVKVAGRYHRRAVQLAEGTGDPVEIGHAYLGLGFHEHQGCGNWAMGLEYYGRALATYREAGELRGMGAIIALIAWVHIVRGNFARSLDYSRELIRLGQDGGDQQVWGWGEMRLGQALRRTGETDQAILHLEKAVELLEMVPDFVASSMASGDLGQCYLLRGKLEQALSLLERTNRQVVERRLRGFLCTVACNSLAKAYLIVAEQAAEPAKSAILKKSRRACRRALRQCALDREGLSGACRLRGTYEWLTGRHAAAEKWWTRSVVVAEELEARYDLASTYREMGRHMGKEEYLKQAGELFQQIGVKIER